MVEFAYLILLVVGVLQIVLFFKLWGMTNDVHALKEDHFRNREIEDIPQLRAYLREHVILENDEKVKKALIGDFLDHINSKCNPSRTAYLTSQTPNMDIDITPYVDLLRKQMEKVGMEVPEVILKMKTFRDYYEMFGNEDFRAVE